MGMRVTLRNWLLKPSKEEAKETADFWESAEMERADGRDMASLLAAQLDAAWQRPERMN